MGNGLDVESATLAEVLERRALSDGGRTAYSFLPDGGHDRADLTYAALDRRARAIAALIQAYGAEDARVLLVYPTCLEFIAAFFGCLYAGVAAVPVAPPEPGRPELALARLAGIASDAQATLALTTREIAAAMRALGDRAGDLCRIRWLATEETEREAGSCCRAPRSSASRALAMLQYTSGSTGRPKGVMLTHANLLEHGRLCHRILQSGPHEVIVSWLPLYHDMGLIGSIVYPQQAGHRSVLLSPAAFLQHPYRWLRAISDHGGTLGVAPNFAYDLCARKITPEQATTLDLSRWTAALNGSERVRADTMERFARAFEVSGFRRNAFVPCYGLAEATLMVSAGPRGRTFVSVGADRQALSRGALRTDEDVGAGTDEDVGAGTEVLVGCGAVRLGQRVAIVGPQSGVEAADGEVGEIWVCGPSVAQGYWNKPQETVATFGARIAGTGEGPYLRTGDLGLVHGGQLFVTGRIKDVVIIRGQNHYPEDIERTAGESHRCLRPGSAAAFSVEGASEEHLVVLHELRTEETDTAKIAEAICAAVAVGHRLRVDCVVLVRARSLPKTSSGKVRRHLCRERFVGGTLDAIGEWRSAAMIAGVRGLPCGHDGGSGGGARDSKRETERDGGAIRDWLVTRFAELRGLPASGIDVRKDVATYGFDSAEAAMLAAELEEWLGVELPPGLVWDHPTIEALTGALADFAAAAPPAAGELLMAQAPRCRVERISVRGQ